MFVDFHVRYPGDPQGQAWVGGARQYMAIKRVAGLDVPGFGLEEWQDMRFEWLENPNDPMLFKWFSDMSLHWKSWLFDGHCRHL